MSVLKVALVLTDRFLAMHVSMSLDIAGVHPSLRSSRAMAFKGAGSKDTDGSATREAVKRVSMTLLIYKDTKLIVKK